MEETFRIAVETHPRHTCFGEITERRKPDDEMVGFVGDEDSYVHPPQARQLQGEDDGVVGDEIGGGDPELFPSGIDAMEKHQFRCLHRVGGSCGDHQHRGVALF